MNNYANEMADIVVSQTIMCLRRWNMWAKNGIATVTIIDNLTELHITTRGDNGFCYGGRVLCPTKLCKTINVREVEKKLNQTLRGWFLPKYKSIDEINYDMVLFEGCIDE